MAGCGSKKKMAKGGMVSPRKAMAMGKKPKKFAKGGMARTGAPVLNSTNVDTVRPRGMTPVNVTAPRPVMTPRPAQTQTQMRAAVDAAARMQGLGAAMGGGNTTGLGAGMARVNTGRLGAALGQAAGLRRPGFKKGGMVKKGKK